VGSPVANNASSMEPSANNTEIIKKVNQEIQIVNQTSPETAKLINTTQKSGST
jgi:hypothetical protein